MSEENKAGVCRIIGDLFNVEDASIADWVFAADYVDRTAFNPEMPGPENNRV